MHIYWIQEKILMIKKNIKVEGSTHSKSVGVLGKGNRQQFIESHVTAKQQYGILIRKFGGEEKKKNELS